MLLTPKALKEPSLSLAELAEAFDISIFTARKYVQEVIPFNDRQGEGKAVRYGQDMVNNFQFLALLKEKNLFSLPQIRAVMEELGQVQINRVVNGQEPLEIGFAVVGEDYRVKVPKVSGKHSMTVLVEDQSARLLSPTSIEGGRHQAKLATWRDFPEVKPDVRVKICYRGTLTDKQRRELAVAYKLVKAIVQPSEADSSQNDE